MTTLPTLRRAIHAQLASPHISVREAAVNLVGMYTSSTNQYDTYLEPLIRRLSDDGVSVRRRVVKILSGGIPLLSGKQRAVVSHHLLKCAANPKEEESLQDLIYDVFVQLWFEVPKCKDSVRKSEGHYVNVSEQMVNIVCYGQTNHFVLSNIGGIDNLTTQYIANIVKERSTGYGHHGDDNNEIEQRYKRLAKMEKHCKRIVEALLEHLLSFEEKKEFQNDDLKENMSLEHIILTIDTISRGNPKLVDMNALQILLPYLKPDTDKNTKTSRHSSTLVALLTLNIIIRTLPFLSSSDAASVSASTLGDIVKLCYAGIGEQIVCKATEALCCFERYTNDKNVRVKILKAAGKFAMLDFIKDT